MIATGFHREAEDFCPNIHGRNVPMQDGTANREQQSNSAVESCQRPACPVCGGALILGSVIALFERELVAGKMVGVLRAVRWPALGLFFLIP